MFDVINTELSKNVENNLMTAITRHTQDLPCEERARKVLEHD